MTIVNKDAMMITHKFGLAKREVERLSLKIHIQKGAWFFKKHIYSVEELLESEHYDKIFAICEKIGNDVYHWHLNEKLSQEGFDTYEKEREGIRRQLTTLNKEIQNRLPTVWENFLSVFEGFIIVVMRVLPTVAKIIKMISTYLEIDDSKLLGAGKSQKLLPKPNDEIKT